MRQVARFKSTPFERLEYRFRKWVIRRYWAKRDPARLALIDADTAVIDAVLLSTVGDTRRRHWLIWNQFPRKWAHEQGRDV
jgi:hypothetical protein